MLTIRGWMFSHEVCVRPLRKLCDSLCSVGTVLLKKLVLGFT